MWRQYPRRAGREGLLLAEGCLNRDSVRSLQKGEERWDPQDKKRMERRIPYRGYNICKGSEMGMHWLLWVIERRQGDVQRAEGKRSLEVLAEIYSPQGGKELAPRFLPISYDDFENVISPHGFLLSSLYSWRWLPESILLKHLKSYGKNSLVIFLISVYQLGSNRTSLLPTLQNHDIHFLSPLKIKNYCFHISGKSLLKSP